VLVLKVWSPDSDFWQDLLQEALHAVRMFLCTTTNTTQELLSISWKD